MISEIDIDRLARHRMGEAGEDHDSGDACDPFFGHEYCVSWARAVVRQYEEEDEVPAIQGTPLH